jgi:ubiquitin C-terminal hydrolase
MFQEYSNKGLSGLTNLGNTCFMNTCLQALSHTYELNNFLKDEKYKSKLNPKCDSIMLVEWDKLRKLMWSSNVVISPSGFLKNVQKVAEVKGQLLFTGFLQNDLPEFLIFMIDCFHTAISRKVNIKIGGTSVCPKDELAIKCYSVIQRMYSNDYSEIWNLFYAIHVSQLTTVDTHECISQTPEPYFMIDLPIPSENKSPDLLDCFKSYIRGELLENVLNETRNVRETVQKQILFWSFPTILVIDLKRFTANNRKDQRLVTFPLDNLDLSSFVIGYEPETYKYDLYAVCNHSGNVLGGHYTAFIKNANGKWYHINDTNVMPIEEREVVSSKAYCLFYRKKTLHNV